MGLWEAVKKEILPGLAAGKNRHGTFPVIRGVQAKNKPLGQQ
jgi:hypothetical protein